MGCDDQGSYHADSAQKGAWSSLGVQAPVHSLLPEQRGENKHCSTPLAHFLPTPASQPRVGSGPQTRTLGQGFPLPTLALPSPAPSLVLGCDCSGGWGGRQPCDPVGWDQGTGSSPPSDLGEVSMG